MSYRIKSVASLTGINTATLRAWERRYSLVSPNRTQGGYRVYSDEDVSTITRVKALMDRGLKVGEAISIVQRAEPVLSVGEAAESTREIGAGILESLVAFDRVLADRLYDRLAALTFQERVEEVLMPVLREVGDRWARGEVGVAAEHFATAFVREKLAWMLGFLSAAPAHGPEVVLAGRPGELHEMGLLAAAVHLAARGWHVVYLGADVPLEELRRTLPDRRPALLCSSVILALSVEECLDLAGRMRAAAPPETHVVLGGAGIPEAAAEVPIGGVTLLRRLQDTDGLLDPARRER